MEKFLAKDVYFESKNLVFSKESLEHIFCVIT